MKADGNQLSKVHLRTIMGYGQGIINVVNLNLYHVCVNVCYVSCN